MSKWYCYSGEVKGPYYNTKQAAETACGPDEKPRPIHNDVCPDVIDVEGAVVDDDDAGDDTEDFAEYSDWKHSDLKAEAENRGIADSVDMRYKAEIIQALEADDERGD